ncbi:hypothetical protein FRC96_03835 [Lujinxingia vulgaris]|uniref:Uncharacterized protein n=1 Tax=Lujinxingia vulgaris TaxID=2600176 RepID=A0A5C6XMD7_9DELT|nr:hypothetical protein [Lujinxingia vulgaris]TXD41686.1 hypothetical protein FRC96_03835 [Lujinxingia vulgaris]
MSRGTLRVGLGTVLVWVCVLFVPTVSAQPTEAEIGETATFLTLFPELRAMGAPEWVQPGVRVSYQTAAGGVIQYDVVHRDGAQVLLHQHSYLDGGAGVVLAGQAVGRGLPGLGPVWLNPQVLAGAESKASAQLSVSRYSRNVAGTMIEVVRFQTQTTNGQTVFEFSAGSGTLVFSSVASPGSAAQMTMVNRREVALPWEAGRAPGWVRPGTRLEYAGSKTTAVSGAGTSQQEVVARAELAQAGAGWSLAQMSTAVQGVFQGGGVQATGSVQPGGALWLSQQALSVVAPSVATAIDVDPVTGAQLFLLRESDGSVVLQQLLSGATQTWVYSPELGVLERQIQETRSPASTEVIDIRRVGGSDLEALSQLEPLPDDPAEVGGAAGGAGRDGEGGGCRAAASGGPGSLWVLVLLMGVGVSRVVRRGGVRARC